MKYNLSKLNNLNYQTLNNGFNINGFIPYCTIKLKSQAKPYTTATNNIG